MKICYISKDALQLIKDGDEEMREWYLEILNMRMENPFRFFLITDSFYDTYGER